MFKGLSFSFISMSHASLHRNLAEKQRDIFSAIPAATASLPQLHVIQEAVFSSLLLALGNKGDVSPEARLGAAAENTATIHTLAEQITALDHLERAIHKSLRSDFAYKDLTRELLQTAGFFRKARKIIVGAYSSDRSTSKASGAGSTVQSPEKPGSIPLFDEVMHKILDPSIGPTNVLRLICESVLEVTTADMVAIFMMDRATNMFHLRHVMANDAPKTLDKEKVSASWGQFKVSPHNKGGDIGLFEIALAEKRPIFSADIENDPRVNMPDLLSKIGIKAMLLIPMFESDKPFGFMSVALAAKQTFSPEETESLSLFANQAAVAWRNAELHGELRKSEKKYRNLIENAIDIIFIVDLEGRFVSINKRAEEITGYKVEDLVGRPFSDLINPEDLPRVMDGWSGGLEGGTEIMPVKIKNARGEAIHLEVNSSMCEEDGELKGLMAIARDTTLETKREEEFQHLHASVLEANQKLEDSMAKLRATQAKLIQTEKLSAMSELISGIAHELNNPLTGVIGYAQLLLETTRDPESRRGLEKVGREAIRCKKIVQNLLGFSRHHKPQQEIVDVNAIVLNVLELKECSANSDDIRHVTHLAEDPPQVMGDFRQLQDVFMNILSNACFALTSSNGGGTIEITTETDRHNGCGRIYISDDGPGILPENLPRIFDPFFTTRETGQGTGLGLSLAYGIVQRHGGQISAESVPHKGTTLKIQLPLARSQAESVETELLKTQQSPSRAQAYHALVVDDEEVILDLLTDILAQMGLSVERACNGMEALQKIAASRFDFIICDMKMPGMDGGALYRTLQEKDPGLSKRIIFSTGDTLSEEFRSFCATTDCKIIEKPFLIEDIKEAIEALDKP